jgi:hypothetical protein
VTGANAIYQSFTASDEPKTKKLVSQMLSKGGFAKTPDGLGVELYKTSYDESSSVY